MAQVWLLSEVDMSPKRRPHLAEGPKYSGYTSPTSPLVALADGTLFPESANIEVLVHDDEGITMVEVALQVSDGCPIVTGVFVRPLEKSTTHVGPLSITPTMLHNLNFRMIFDTATQTASFVAFLPSDNPLRDKPFAQAAARNAQTLGRRRQPLTDALLTQVANIVNHNKYDPRKQVASEFYVSGRTASRWIAEARGRGLIDRRLDNG